jgi:hypothetical protein
MKKYMKENSKIKFVNKIQVDWSFDDLMKDIGTSPPLPDLNKLDQAYFLTKDNQIIQGFLYLNNGNPVVVPEPEPSILYLSNSERIIDNILHLRTDIFNSNSLQNIVVVDVSLFSDFFLLAFNFVVNLFASIEAFNNSVIPENFTFGSKKGLMNREEIQRKESFDIKVKKVVPQVFNKSFVVDFIGKYESLNKLRNIRDSLIHTKNFSKNWAASYRDIYRELLAFDFENVLSYTKDYMNYYKPNWIEKLDK